MPAASFLVKGRAAQRTLSNPTFPPCRWFATASEPAPYTSLHAREYSFPSRVNFPRVILLANRPTRAPKNGDFALYSSRLGSQRITFSTLPFLSGTFTAV